MEEKLKKELKELLERRQRLDNEIKVYDSEESREPIQYNIDKVTWELEDKVGLIKKDIIERETISKLNIDKLKKEADEAIAKLEMEANEPITKLKKELEMYSDSESREPIQYNIDKFVWKLEENVKNIRNGLEKNIKSIENELQNYKDNAFEDLDQIGIDFKEFGLDKIKYNKSKEAKIEEKLEEPEVEEKTEEKKEESNPIPSFLRQQSLKVDTEYEKSKNAGINGPIKSEEKSTSGKKVSYNNNLDNVKIIVGREAKIIIGDETIKVDGKYVKEGINLNYEELKEFIFERNEIQITDISEKELKNAFEKGLIDSTVLNIIDRANLTTHERRTLLNDQINKVKAVINKEEHADKSEVKYDMNDLSKTSFIKRLLKKEINTDEKNALINNARVTNQNGISTIDGEYKPDWKSKFLAKIMRKDILMLPSKVENTQTEKGLRDRIVVDNSDNKIENNVNKIVQETEQSIANDVKVMINDSETEK